MKFIRRSLSSDQVSPRISFFLSRANGHLLKTTRDSCSCQLWPNSGSEFGTVCRPAPGSKRNMFSTWAAFEEGLEKGSHSRSGSITFGRLREDLSRAASQHEPADWVYGDYQISRRIEFDVSDTKNPFVFKTRRR
ncbi:hypothetical protein CLIM01_05186 [Colletotrichum limetticola]|uniref:Uncharacterized protein n=1 Tax=Colletotrichum limetticola TaxID=1209924 RepID=A0ABQ9Q0Y7_9PEZI|nr:hypothetical protein CLIM01_05186 [Colletotrichum limetticola]